MGGTDTEVTVYSVVDLIETIWLPLDPNQMAEWCQCLKDKDLKLAEEVIMILRDADSHRPSVRLFDAAYRGYSANRPETPKNVRYHPGARWFDEQRAKLRPKEEAPPQEQQDLWQTEERSATG